MVVTPKATVVVFAAKTTVVVAAAQTTVPTPPTMISLISTVSTLDSAHRCSDIGIVCCVCGSSSVGLVGHISSHQAPTPGAIISVHVSAMTWVTVVVVVVGNAVGMAQVVHEVTIAAVIRLVSIVGAFGALDGAHNSSGVSSLYLGSSGCCLSSIGSV
jgi:hypothetical protein